jgi:uroporphyrin-III C-methyltransferase/precorrin-2 dehydrogenase/sirohydrochlorin ferrochelatase
VNERLVEPVMLPITLSLHGRPCLVVGGGAVALRKARALLEAGASITVVSPAPDEALQALAELGRLTLERRQYRDGEARAYRLVFAATDSRETNLRVAADAEAGGIWVNVADDPGLCSFHLPARVRRGDLQVALASRGAAPFAVRRLRDVLEERLASEWGEWMAAAARFRSRVRTMRLDPAESERLFDRFFAETVDTRTLAVRIPTVDEESAWVAGPTAAPNVQLPAPARRAGFVSLVGAGPGDPGLLTVRAVARLRAADAVVFDRLAEPALPPDLPAGVELYPVGKETGFHAVPQDEINALLVRLAREGKRVVRLKGGDPCVFGRGAEEAEALGEAGVAYEIVPGVTAGTAVPTYAGIPVTSRNEAARVTFATAHESAKDADSLVRWDLLAGDPHATLVAYMGVAALQRVTAALLAAGMDPGVPAAVIERGTTPAQRVVWAPVGELAAQAQASGIRPPALVVIGPTVRHVGRLDWFTRRPLAGERLAVAAPAGSVKDALEAAGAEVVEVPLPLTPAARIVLQALPITGCLLRTAREVDAFASELETWGHAVVAWCLRHDAAARARSGVWGDLVETTAGEGWHKLIRAMEERRAVTIGR